MKKRILALFTTIALMMSAVPYAFSEEKDISNTDMDFVEALGAFNKVKKAPESIVTRGEFASVLANITGMVESESTGFDWGEFNYGEDYNDTLISAEGNALKFRDVDKTYPYYNEIMAISARGYMKGIASDLFAPEYGMTLINAIKVISDMMGYEKYAVLYGGYPTGYQTVASENNLIDGISKDYTEVLTQNDLIRIIHNALDVSVVKVSELNGNDATLEQSTDETFLTDVLKLEEIKGVITDNGISNFYGESTVSGNQIIIEDTVLWIDEATEYARDLIGRHVEAYFSVNDDEKELRYVRLSGKDKTYSFNIEDMEKFSQSEISYCEGAKKITKKTANNVALILNGAAVKTFDESTFDFQSGSVTLVSFEGSVINVILVDKYDYINVRNVDTTDEIIYSSYIEPGKNADSWDLSEDGKYENIKIINEDGTRGSITDIASGMILKISENDRSIKLEVVNKKIENFTVKSVYSEDDVTYISGAEGTFKVYEKYLSSSYTPVLRNGEIYTIYLGDEDIVVWAEAMTAEDKVGYIIKSWQDENEDELITVRLYGFDGQMKEFELAKKVKVWAKDGTLKTLTSSNAYTLHLQGVKSIVKYDLNDEKKINYIELPAENGSADGQLHAILETTSQNKGSYVFVGSGMVGGKFVYNGNTKAIRVPAKADDVNGYSTINITSHFDGANNRVMSVYASKAGTALADYIVFHKETSEVDTIGALMKFVAVEDLTVEMHDDEVATKLTGMVVGSQLSAANVTLYSVEGDNTDADGNPCTAFQSVPDSMQTKENGKLKLYDIKKGDIIRCVYDADGNVTLADIVYRPTATNAEFPNSKAGTILGSTGYYDSSKNNGNPYALVASGALNTNAWPFARGNYRAMLGFVIRTEDEAGILHTTTKDLTSAASVDLNNIESKYICNDYKLLNAITIEYSGKNVTVKKGSINDIKSYEEVGKDCSRVFFCTYYGSYVTTVIINGFMN